MKKILTLIISLLMVVTMMSAVAVTADAPNPAVVVDGTQLEFDVAPYIENEKVFVPFRKVAEALGISVQWDGETRTVIAMNADTAILIQIDNTFAFVDSAAVEMDVPAVIKEDRTFVSLDFLSNNIGSKVEWDANTNTITVTTAAE